MARDSRVLAEQFKIQREHCRHSSIAGTRSGTLLCVRRCWYIVVLIHSRHNFSPFIHEVKLSYKLCKLISS